MTTIGVNAIAAYPTITLSYLRNGPASDVVRTSRESSIAAKYNYSGPVWRNALAGDPTARAAPVPTAVIMDAHIRCAFGTLVEAEVNQARTNAAAAAPAVAFNEAAARAAAVSNPVSRTEAIAIGSVRATLTLSYHVGGNEIYANERDQCPLTLTPPAVAADDAAYAAQVATPLAGWTVAVANPVPTAADAVIVNMTPLTADEVDFAYAAASIGMASPVRAGCQLLADGHHYHSAADASARHRAIEREVFARVGTAAAAFWRANTAVLRNAMWHAAIHPVNAGLLEDLATDLDMVERLSATGFGSMAVGVPAMEDLFSRAGSYVAVYNQVLQTATAHGHTLSIADLQATVTALTGLPRKGPLPAARPDLPGLPSAPWPAGCTSRAKALKLFLEPALNKADPVAAWMFGFYKELASRAGIRPNSTEGSLLRSYSLKRASTAHLGETNRAQEMYAARAKWIKSQAEEGKLETYVGSA